MRVHASNGNLDIGEVIAQEIPKTPTPPFDQNQSLNRTAAQAYWQ